MEYIAIITILLLLVGYFWMRWWAHVETREMDAPYKLEPSADYLQDCEWPKPSGAINLKDGGSHIEIYSTKIVKEDQ